jgi:peptide/nickel transport system permease protein
MLSNAQELITSAPLLAIYPGMMIFLTVIACNLCGDALQQRFDRRAAVRV